MNKISIRREVCIGCGQCAKDCPGTCIRIRDNKAEWKENSYCIECGHCYAVCPVNAIRMEGYDGKEEAITPMTAIDSDTLLSAMKSRRTIRQFKDRPVEAEKILKILEAGRYSPTGGNSQSVEFTILGSRQNRAEEICLNLFRSGKKAGSVFIEALKNMDIPDHFFFKGAPLVIVVSARNKTDGALASSYMEIMAESLGLGVLYSGFFIACTAFSPKLRRLLALPKGQKAVTCMVIGVPDVNYKRIVPRRPVHARML